MFTLASLKNAACLPPPFLIEHFLFCFCLMFPHDQIEVIQFNWITMQIICVLLRVSLLEAHDIHLSLTDYVNFDYMIHMWLEFSTV